MKLSLTTKIAIVLLLAGAVAVKVAPQSIAQAFSRIGTSNADISQHYELVPDSIYDGDSFRVSDGEREIKVRICGIDAPEKEQALGIESRDHLRQMMAKGTGRVTLVETDIDQYGRTVAEVFIPTGNGDEEIHLNTQMVADGMAYVYPQYVSSCPNGSLMQSVGAEAQQRALGVWANPNSQKPWDYRRQS
ncbi:MAG: thermonuclease family protein [Phormidesmis sp.]